MGVYKFIISNQDPVCGSSYEQTINTSGCTTFLLKLNTLSTSEGPFNIYIDTINSTPIYTNVSRSQLLTGLQYSLECPTPSATPPSTPCVTRTPTITPTPTLTSGLPQTPTPTISSTPSITPSITPTISVTKTITPSITPTISITPSLTPSITPSFTPSITPSLPIFYAYIFAEPQTFNDGANLENYMINNYAASWGGYQFYGVPDADNYSNNMNIYAHYSGWTSNEGNYTYSPTALSGVMKRTNNYSEDSFGCPQNQYTFETIRIHSNQLNTDIKYFYSIWIPTNSIGGVMNNMLIDAGSSPCGTDYSEQGIPDAIASQNVFVTSGAAIPVGQYRVIFLALLNLPNTNKLLSDIYIKGNLKI